jgi:hypothetical protein
LRDQADRWQIGAARVDERRWALVRWLLPLGWLVGAAGYFGPWIDHPSAALVLSGADMGEFVKFLPAVVNGTLAVHRQVFYSPALALVATVALLAGSIALRYRWALRLVMVSLAVPVSLQLLPPAWSVASLTAPEFRLQVMGLLVCWLLLGGLSLLGRMPLALSAVVTTLLCLSAAVLSTWQLLLAKPSIDQVYGRAPAIGWGFYACVAGLVVTALLALTSALPATGSGRPRESEE